MIYSWSQFNYGQTASLETQNIPFKEATGPSLLAIVPIGSYSLADYVQAIEDAFNSTGQLVYHCTVDRSTNVITVSATGTFTLFTSQSSTAFPTMGFTQTMDLTGSNTYTGNQSCGQRYYPQFKLQSYVPGSNYAQSVSATINESASGLVEVVRFGISRLIEMEIKFITNLPMDGSVIRSNRFGLQDALQFLNYATTKAPFEFVPDVGAPSVFTKVILDKTESAADGTGFKLKELYAENIPDVYETGLLTMRVI